MKYLMLTLILLSTPGMAEVYKGKNAEGNTIYSDEPMPDSTEIQVPDPTSIPMPKPVKKKAAAPKNQEGGLYQNFSILSPGNDETIQNTSGSITITLGLTPTLQTKEGHTISVNVDGKPAVEKTQQLTIQVPGISRGTHTVMAEVIDRSGKTVISSNTITINTKNPSNQHKKPSDKNAPGPKKPDGTPYTPGPKKPDGSPYTPGPQGVPFKPGPIPTPPPASAK